MSGMLVVGIDGSETSRRALEWGLDLARWRGMSVRAVMAWHYPVSSMLPFIETVPPADVMEAATREALDGFLADWLPDGADVEIERVVEEGPAASVIVDKAADAEIVVLGARGHGGFSRALLGSTASSVVNHANCVVVVVPNDT